MGWIEVLLTRLERHLRDLIEREPVVDGISRKFHNQLERELIIAMKTSVRKLPQEQDPGMMTLTSPDQYTLVLPSIEAQLLLTHPAELDRLINKLQAVASQSEIVFTAAPIIHVVADPNSTEIKVDAEYSQAGVDGTATKQVEGILDSTGQAGNLVMPKAFLIVNGLSTFPLTEPVVNIGRDPSNQVHLDDLRVSRMHAQLRLSQERFVIFDLDSLGGTFVNGVAVSSHVLNPGDVILLAGVPLVYGQEEASQVGYTQELPVDPPALEVL